MPDLINERIKKYRIEKKYKQVELGEKLGLKCSTYSQMERQGTISVEMALKIAEILEVDPNLIIYGEEPDGKLDLSSVKPQKVVAKAPITFIDGFYDTSSKKNDEAGLSFALSNTEKSIISIYHNLPKAKQKQVREFIDNLRKNG